ncbi:hypothetical protein D3C72_2072020 [compost metagenome]
MQAHAAADGRLEAGALEERQRGAVRQDVLGPDAPALGVERQAERALVKGPRPGHVLDRHDDEVDEAIAMRLVLALVQH